jgi:hypothetical protein
MLGNVLILSGTAIAIEGTLSVIWRYNDKSVFAQMIRLGRISLGMFIFSLGIVGG